jgi:transposase-like protein
MPNNRHRASGTTRVPPRHFIPGTNLIESMNARLRKVTRNRSHFPTEQA